MVSPRNRVLLFVHQNDDSVLKERGRYGRAVFRDHIVDVGNIGLPGGLNGQVAVGNVGQRLTLHGEGLTPGHSDLFAVQGNFSGIIPAAGGIHVAGRGEDQLHDAVRDVRAADHLADINPALLRIQLQVGGDIRLDGVVFRHLIALGTGQAADGYGGRACGLHHTDIDLTGVKPVQPRVLLARIRALLRRTDKAPEDEVAQRIEFDDLVIDNGGRSVTLNGELVDFTSAEYDLLWLLASNAGRILSREDIFERLRGIEYDGQDRSIDVRISRIRPKIGDDPENPKRIKTVRSKGYLFVKETNGL